MTEPDSPPPDDQQDDVEDIEHGGHLFTLDEPTITFTGADTRIYWKTPSNG